MTAAPTASTSPADMRDLVDTLRAIQAATFEAAVDGILVVDAERRVVSRNRRFVELWDLPPEIAATSDDHAVLSFAVGRLVDRDAFLAKVNYLYDHPTESSQDEVVLSTGRVLERHSAPVIDDAGAIRGRVWFFHDVTARRAAEARLRAAHAFVDSIVEHTPTAVFVLEAQTLRCVRCNRAAERMLGYRRDDLLGRSYHDFLPRADADRMAAGDRAALASDAEVVDEALLETHDRGLRRVRTKRLAIRDTDGVPRYVLGISDDITDERERQAEVFLAKERAERASRAKSDFLLNMSHELRTPLNAILGFARVLRRTSAAAGDERAYLDDIVRASEHMLALINDLLDMRSLDTVAVEVAPVALASPLDEAIAMVRPLYDEKRHTLEVDVPDDLAVLAERRAIVQILVNLLSNAGKYTPSGGAIRVSAERRGAQVRVAVRDNGIGIAEADRGKLFTYFEQLGAKHTHKMKGSGVGLALTRAMVEKLGGTIDVESAPGQGSTFAFTLRAAG